MGAFIALYLQAASMYPGGTPSHHEIHGYSHLSNYWCDLLDRVSYSGNINQGRPFAILATIALPILLIPFWFQVPILFRDRYWLQRLVQATGPAAMVISTLIFTRLHDLAINVASILGFVATVATIRGLVGKEFAALNGVALLSMIFAITNYLMWQTSSFLLMMPIVQKATFALFFIWIIATTYAIRRVFRTSTALNSHKI